MWIRLELKIFWREYYDLNRNFLYREEYRYLKLKDVLLLTMDQTGHITLEGRR